MMYRLTTTPTFVVVPSQLTEELQSHEHRHFKSPGPSKLEVESFLVGRPGFEQRLVQLGGWFQIWWIAPGLVAHS